VAFRLDICDKYEDLSDSNSLTVIVGMERGVGAGGSSKSSRLNRLLCLPGVATLWRDL
jgi:hypothetical protein